MPLSNPYQRYQQTATQTAGSDQLLIMSYEAVIRWLNRAETAIDEENVEGAHSALVNAQEILRDLKWNLNMARGGEVAENLSRIYDYLTGELVWANVEKSQDRIANVRHMIQPLLEAWRVAVVKARRERLGTVTPNPAGGVTQAG
jgi:flagellar secretion chaperone FliS